MYSVVTLNLSGRPYALFMIECFKQDKIDEFRDLILEDMVCEHTGYYMHRWEVARSVYLHMHMHMHLTHATHRSLDDKLWTRVFEWAASDRDAGSLWDYITSSPRRNAARNSSSTIPAASMQIIDRLAAQRVSRKRRVPEPPVPVPRPSPSPSPPPPFTRCKHRCLKRIPLASAVAFQ